MKPFAIGLWLACLLLFCAPVYGQFEVGLSGTYVQLDTRNGNLASRAGFGGGVAFRMQFLEHFRLGIETQFLQFQPEGEEPAAAPTYKLYPLELSLDYTPFLNLPVKPYISAAAGFYHLQFETEAAEGIPNPPAQSDLGFGGAIGIRVPLKGPLELDTRLGYRYLPAEEGPRTLIPLQLGLTYRFEN